MTDQRDWTRQTALLAGPSVVANLSAYVPSSTGYDQPLVASPGAGKFIRFWTLEVLINQPSGFPADVSLSWSLYTTLATPLNVGGVSPAHPVDPRLWAGGLDAPINTAPRFSAVTAGWADGRLLVSATYTIIGG